MDEELEQKLEQAINQVREWAVMERYKYSDMKFHNLREKEIETIKSDPHLESNPHIFHGIGDYLKRAELFGLDTPQGRQALGKALVTVESLLSDSIVAHGNLPEPGFPSGEIRIWGLWEWTYEGNG